MSAIEVFLMVLAVEFTLGCLVAVTFLLRWQAYRRTATGVSTDGAVPSLRL